MTSPRVESTRVPYVPIAITAGSPPRVLEAEALVDTGFTGHVVVPRGTLTDGNPPHQYVRWRVAGGATINAPAYWGNIRIGSTELAGVLITELGSETIIGMQVVNHFTLIIDHGRMLILQP